MSAELTYTDAGMNYGIDIALCINRSIEMQKTIRDLADGITDLPAMLAQQLYELSYEQTLHHLRVRVIAFGSSASGDEMIESPFFDFADGGADGLADFLRSIPLTHVRKSVDSITALNAAFASPWMKDCYLHRRFIILLSDIEIDTENEAVAADAQSFAASLNSPDGMRNRRTILFTPENVVADGWFDGMRSTFRVPTQPHGGCRDVDLKTVVSILANSL